MAFLLTTTAEITLTDLGNRVIPTATSNFDLEAEYSIEEIRYSESLASAIFAGDATAVDQFGRSITAQGSLALTQALLKLSFHIDDTDALPEGTSNLFHTDTRSRNSISVEAGENNLTYNSGTGELNFSNGPTFSENVIIQGDLDVLGTTTTVGSEDLVVTDNTITLNHGETGAGVTLGQSGIKIDRGTEDPYVFLFDENSDTFRIGSTIELTDGSFVTSELQAVATREDNPQSEGIAFWNTTESRFDTDSSFYWDESNEYLYVGSSYVSQTKIDAWDSMASGGITSVTAGDGLTSTGTNDITLNVVGGNGITANSDDIEVNVDGSTIEVNGSDNLGIIAGGVTETELAASVAGAGLAGGVGTPLSVNVDSATLTIATDIVKVADGGITSTQLNSSVAGDGLAGGAGTALSVNVDDSTIGITTDTLEVKDSGITATQIATSVAGDGLAGGGGTALSVNVDGSTIAISGDTLGVPNAGITATQIAASVAGAGLAGGAGTALSVNVDDSTIEISGDTLQVKADGIDDTHINWGTAANQVNAEDIPIIDAGANFTAVNVEEALLEIYNNAGAKYLEDLLDVDMPTGTLGGNDVLKYNDSTSQWEPGSIAKTWTVAAVSDAKNTTNRYLDRQDGLATNMTPYISFYDAFIRKIVLNAYTASTWSAEIRINGSTAATLASSGAKNAVSADLAVEINAGDEISIYASGSGIDRPGVEVLFEQDIF